MDAVVETRSGRVRGSARHGALAFFGIPYARPIEGKLRFAAPEPAEPWSGARDTTSPGLAAPQRSLLPRWLAGLGGGASAVGADCLHVNVFTPNLRGAGRPVLVWIHGGGFAMGSGSAAVYDGTSLAREHDVVVITLNYRLGALGFGQLDTLAPSGPFASNAGLRDQLAALAWVREHAAAFGGDAANVTVFGESAGAMSVATLLGCRAARGLFARAICQSGGAHHCSSRERAARMAHAFLRALGLTPATAERACELPLEAILDAQLRAAASVPTPWGLLPWQPAIDGDLLPQAPLDAIAGGSARGIPLLLGTNRDEYNLFLLGNRAARGMDEARLGELIARVIGERGVEEAAALYRELLPRARPVARWSTLQTHRVFRAPAERLADLSARHTPSTYSYLFTWTPPLAPRSVGACHALEVPLVFGSWRRPALRLLYASGGDVARAMQASWVAFARTGQPGAARWAPHASAPEPWQFGPRDTSALERFERARPFWAQRGHGPGDVP